MACQPQLCPLDVSLMLQAGSDRVLSPGTNSAQPAAPAPARHHATSTTEEQIQLVAAHLRAEPIRAAADPADACGDAVRVANFSRGDLTSSAAGMRRTLQTFAEQPDAGVQAARVHALQMTSVQPAAAAQTDVARSITQRHDAPLPGPVAQNRAAYAAVRQTSALESGAAASDMPDARAQVDAVRTVPDAHFAIASRQDPLRLTVIGASAGRFDHAGRHVSPAAPQAGSAGSAVAADFDPLAAANAAHPPSIPAAHAPAPSARAHASAHRHAFKEQICSLPVLVRDALCADANACLLAQM